MISQQELEPKNQTNESQHFNYEEASSIEPRYANYATVSPDLHTTTTLQQIPGDTPDQTVERPNHTMEKSEENCPAPGSLPDYVSVYKPETMKWGKRIDGSEIVLQTSVIADAYNKIATWTKNVFLVPCDKTGRDFIDQVTSHFNDWNNGANSQNMALKAAFVLLAAGLQKPSPKSKAKEDQELLSKPLVQWKEGKINKLLHEGRIIQSQIGKLRSTDPPDKLKVFTKLLLEGQIISAL